MLNYPAFSSEELSEKFTTMNESECNSEIHFFKNGKGYFIDSCRGENGLYVGKIYKNEISWLMKEGRFQVKINGVNEGFTYIEKLSCKYFGEVGYANGLVGFDMYFWKMPIQCKG